MKGDDISAEVREHHGGDVWQDLHPAPPAEVYHRMQGGAEPAPPEAPAEPLAGNPDVERDVER